MKNTVIFDMFQVLVEWKPEIFYANIITDKTKLEYFLNVVMGPEFDKLKDYSDNLALAIKPMKEKYPEFAEYLEIYPENEHKMVKGYIDGTLKIVQELKAKGVKLYIISNINKESIKWAEKKFDFWPLFDGVVLSGNVNMAKPEKRIFKYLFDKFNVLPEQAIFVDDNERNVTAAKETGLDAIQFTEPKKLREQLASYNLL